MKVILKQDVKSIGKKGELHEVSDGYGRNYLMPRGLAMEADAASVKEVNAKEASKQHHAQVALDTAKAAAEKLEGTTVSVKAKAGQGGRLFGAVTSKDIVAALKKQGIEVEKRKLTILGGDIKNFGSYEVEAKICAGVTAKFTCKVEE